MSDTTDDAALVAELRRLSEYLTCTPWGPTNGGLGFAVVNPDGRPATGGMRVGMFPHVGRGNRTDDVNGIVAMRNALPRLLAMADEAIALREVRDAAAWARSEWNEVAGKATCDVDYLGDLRSSMNSLDRALDKYVKKLSERAALDADAARGKS